MATYVPPPHNPPKMPSTHVAIAACDGMRSGCALSEVPDRGGCNATVPKTPPLTRAFVRAYTPAPAVYYTGGPCAGARLRLFDPNQTDPASPDAPHWREVQRLGFVSEGGACVPDGAPARDGLLAVVEVPVDPGEYEADSLLTFGRLPPPNGTELFAVAEARGEWAGSFARVAVELDDRYVFPGCAGFPMEADDAEGRLWRQAEQESTCGVVDSALYVHEGLRPSLQASHNATHLRWRFDVRLPGAPPVSVDVFVPFESEPVSAPPTYRLLGAASAPSPLPRALLVAGVVLLALACFAVGFRKRLWRLWRGGGVKR